VIVGPDGTRDEYVVNEVIFHPAGPAELNAFLSRYGGTILRDGKPLMVEGVQKPADLPESTGWYLIRVDLGRASLDDLAANMQAAGLLGHAVFSSESAARLAALVAREAGQEVTANFIGRLDQCVICEHADYPDPGTGAPRELDASTWWWLTEDDNLSLPGDQGLSTGVIHAWDYVKYKGFPPENVLFSPVTLAIIDAGFDLDEATGQPLNGNLDYFYMGSKPKQIDEVGGDLTAGGAGSGFSNCNGCWHGQMTFGAALAHAHNSFGSAGTAGSGEAWPLLIKVTGDFDSWANAVYDAIYNGADVINMSLSGQCNWWCRNWPYTGYNVLKAGIGSAMNRNIIVVASAGNDGVDISNGDYIPCKLNGAVCVGGVLSSGAAANYNWGSIVDTFAPTCFRTTITRGSAGGDVDNLGEDELANFCGTSASSPFTAGVVALMKMLDKSVGYDQVRSILVSTGNASSDPKIAPRGYVDAYRAVLAVKPNLPPTVQITSPASGASVSFKDVYLQAKVVDPEKPTPFGLYADYSSRLVFSSDRDGQLCSVSGDATGNGATLSCSVAQLSTGNHILTATATDPFGATASTTLNVTVVNNPTTVKITYPSSGSTFYTSQNINLRGYAFDMDEPISNLGWWSMLHGQPFQFWFPLGSGPDIWTKLAEGTYTIQLVATDSLNVSAYDSITLNVQVGIGYPDVQIQTPLNNSTFGPGEVITFVGSATDPEDGNLTGASLEWSSDIDGFLGTGTTIQTMLSGPPGQEGTVWHTITLQATDSDGHKGTHQIMVGIMKLG
jgi:hypothetical protein